MIRRESGYTSADYRPVAMYEFDEKRVGMPRLLMPESIKKDAEHINTEHRVSVDMSSGTRPVGNEMWEIGVICGRFPLKLRFSHIEIGNLVWGEYSQRQNHAPGRAR